MKFVFAGIRHHLVGRFLWIAFTLAGLTCAQAQPTIVSVNPADGATGVSASSKFVVTFSTAMSTFSTALFSNVTADSVLPVGSPTWSAGNTVATFSPLPTWPANSTISWEIFGFDSSFTPVSGTTSGSFSTGSGGGGGTGSGTNAITTFALGKSYVYDQSSTGAPTPDSTAPYIFSANTTLASNRTATSITLTLPNSAVSNLTQNPSQPEQYFSFDFSTNANTFETAYPSGTYTFTVNAASSNQAVGVVSAPPSAQPNSPHASNFTAAQSVDATKSFTLTWDPFQNGTAGDWIYVDIDGTLWNSGQIGTTNMLTGTATSAIIPANTLQPNTNYSVSVGFYRFTVASNSTYLATAYRASVTRFTLTTILSSAAPPPVITNTSWNGASLSFDVDTAAGQTVTVVGSTDFTTPVAQWPVVARTNSPGRAHIVVAPSASSTGLYRARNGN